jgi:hypothetical protein
MEYKIGDYVWAIQWQGFTYNIVNKKIVFKEENFVGFSPKDKSFSIASGGMGVPDKADYNNIFSTEEEAKQAFMDKGYKEKNEPFYKTIKDLVENYYGKDEKLF